MLSDKGYENLIKVVEEYGGLTIDREFIDKHYAKLSSGFANADDSFYREMYPEPKEAWWTFENECNSGGVSDTSPRDRVLNEVSEILFGMAWPCYGDSAEIHAEFDKKFKEYKNNSVR